jgi:CRP-like cAMP-binding protein
VALTLPYRPQTASYEEYASFFERCPVFDAVLPATKAALARAAHLRHVERNTTLAMQGETWPFFGLVRAGRIYAIVTSPEGRDQILYDAGPGAAFGEIMLIDGGESLSRFVALGESTEVVLLPRDDILTACAADPALRDAVAMLCAQRARTIAELLCSHLSKPVLARVAAILHRAWPEENELIAVKLAQVAAAAGTVKEVAARCLAQIEATGAIRRRHGSIFALDHDKLRALL